MQWPRRLRLNVICSRFLAKATLRTRIAILAFNLIMTNKCNHPGSAPKQLILPCIIFDEREQVIPKFRSSEFAFINYSLVL
jgi:hypothetical protein